MRSPIEIVDTIESIAREIKKQLKDSGNIKREIKNAINHEISRLEGLIPSIETIQPNDGSASTTANTTASIREIVREELSVFKELLQPINVQKMPKVSYANVVIAKKDVQNNTAKPAIIIGAKEGANAKRTDIINVFRKNVSFKNTTYAPAKISPVSNNKVRVEFDSTEQRDETLQKLSEVSELKAENAKNKRPLVILKGVSKEIAVEDLVNIIQNQNASINAESKQDDISFRFARKNRRNPDHVYNAILEVSPTIRNIMMGLGRINIDFQRVNVSDFSAFVQCFRCLQFGHTKNKCSATITPCSHCASRDHQYPSCPDKDNDSKRKCFNCVSRNGKSESKVDEKHSATSSQHCPQIKSMQQVINSLTEYGC